MRLVANRGAGSKDFCLHDCPKVISAPFVGGHFSAASAGIGGGPAGQLADTPVPTPCVKCRSVFRKPRWRQRLERAIRRFRPSADDRRCCLERLWSQAAARGISRGNFERFTAGLTPDLSIMDKLDAQP